MIILYLKGMWDLGVWNGWKWKSLSPQSYSALCYPTDCSPGFPGDSEVKASACNVGNPGSIPKLEYPLEKEMATHSSILAWRIPWREEPGRQQSMGGILQARILEWVALPFSKEFSQTRDRTQVSCIADRFFTSWVTREVLEMAKGMC